MIKLGMYLQEKRILNLKSTTKLDALEELVGAIGDDAALSDREKFLKAVLAREKVMSTGVGDGIAIPHARIPQVTGAFLAIGRSLPGIEYGSADGRPVHLVVLIGASDRQTSLYLQLLSRTLSCFVDAPLRARVLKAQTPREIRELLVSTD